MSHRSIISLAAAVIVGIASVATVSTDALARGGRAGVGVGRPGVGVGYHRVGVGVAPVRRGVRAGVAVGAGAAARGAYCGYAHYPPCY
jgi:hypothetical protein